MAETTTWEAHEQNSRASDNLKDVAKVAGYWKAQSPEAMDETDRRDSMEKAPRR